MMRMSGQEICTSHGGTRHSRIGFTLFEVSISLVLVAFGVISVLMMLPTGLKAQQMARFQILAAAKAEEMIESFTATQSSNPAIDTEGLMMWDVPSTHRSQAWDLEARLSSHRFGLMPLPLDIAKRLDSDGGELEQILAQGGYLYYSQPMATTNLEEQGLQAAPPNEAQKLIIGIAGYAQQNCIHILPTKNWPYHTPWPSPPLHMGHMADRFLPLRNYTPGNNADDFWTYYVWPWRDMWRGGGKDGNDNEVFCVPWETSPLNGDPDIGKVFHWVEDQTNEPIGYFPYACGRIWNWEDGDNKHFRATRLQPTGSDVQKYGQYPSRKSALKYVATTLWYANKKGFDASWYDPPNLSTASPYAPFKGETNSNIHADEANYWKEVQAMRFLSHAATTLTAWFSYNRQGTDMEDLATGVTIPPITLQGVGPSHSGTFRITHDKIRYYNERAHYLINTFASRYPYDWKMPRPLNRVTMMDFPLLQLDLFSPPQPIDVPPSNLYVHFSRWNKGGDGNSNYQKLFGRGGTPSNPQQWRPIAPEPIRNFGVSHTYQVHGIDASQPLDGHGPYFGNHMHYNLTAPFTAAERCREIIMWAVDWQSYEDFETASSAPVDASKYPLAGPRGNWKEWGDEHGWNYPFDERHSEDPGDTPYTRDFPGRMWDVEFRDEQLWAFRNPEKVINFYPLAGTDPRTLPTGTPVQQYMILNNAFGRNDGGITYPDKGPDLPNRAVFNGLYGADRNYNRILDRGPVPKSVRLRAVTVARFSFYDPRVQAVIR